MVGGGASASVTARNFWSITPNEGSWPPLATHTQVAPRSR